MHIIYVCNEYPPAPHGGIGSFTQTLGRALVRRGHQVSVVGLYPQQHVAGGADREEFLDEGIRVIRLSRSGPLLTRMWQNRRRLAEEIYSLHRQSPIDVIEGGELDIANLRRPMPSSVVLRMHGGLRFFAADLHPGKWGLFKEKYAFATATDLCAVSNYVAQTTSGLLDLGHRHIEVILNPVDIDLFQPTPVEQEVPGRIVFAGTITERKGIRQLLAAMPAIVAAVPEAHLEIYGGDAIGVAGPSFAETLRQSIPSALATHIHWMGRVARLKLPEVISRASVCVYPSHMEALPIAWLEGLASGKAVVASRTGPGPEVIDDEVHALLCDPHSPDSIAKQLIRVLKDPALRQRLGAAARQMVQLRFALETVVDRNIAYYERLKSARQNGTL